jgi:hypothetical protein
MDTNEDKLLLKQEVFQIVGSAIEVLNTLGNGLIEKPYENALLVEFGFAKDSISAAAFVRCPLQRTQDWTVRSGPDRF